MAKHRKFALESTSDPSGQDTAHRAGDYNYLNEIALSPRMGVISSFVLSSKSSSVLDIGCGTGALASYLPSNVQYLGIDSSEFAINAALNRFPKNKNRKFKIANFYNFIPKNKFDCIVIAGFGLGMSKNRKMLDSLRILSNHYENYFLDSRAFFIVEAIRDYKRILENAFHSQDIFARCGLDCFGAEKHGRRNVFCVNYEIKNKGQ